LQSTKDRANGGDWRIDREASGVYIVGDRIVAKVSCHAFANDNQTAYPEQNRELRAESDANATLLVNAPQTLAALRQTVFALESVLMLAGSQFQPAAVQELAKYVQLGKRQIAAAEGKAGE
jgi:hypothetical protein